MIAIYHSTIPISLVPFAKQVHAMIHYLNLILSLNVSSFHQIYTVKKQSSILTLASDQVLTQSPPSNHKPLLQYPVSYPPIDLNELATLSVLHSNISSTSPDDQGEIDCYS